MSGSTILSSIKDQIDKLKNLISSGQASAFIIQKLQSNQDRLQSWYDKVLANAGILNEDERVALEKELDSAKKSSMEAQANRGKRKMVFVLVGSLVLITGIVLYIKLKKRA